MAKNEQTSPKAAKAASAVLRDDRTGSKSKTAAGSALSFYRTTGQGSQDDRDCVASLVIQR